MHMHAARLSKDGGRFAGSSDVEMTVQLARREGGGGVVVEDMKTARGR